MKILLSTFHFRHSKGFIKSFQSIINPSLPFYILSAGGFIVAAITLCLPETGISNLPNTLEEGEKFGEGQPFFYLPFLERRKKSAR